MTDLAPLPDPFEDGEWLDRALEECFPFTYDEDGNQIPYPFGYTDPDVIEAEVAKARAYLDSTPTGEPPYAEG